MKITTKQLDQAVQENILTSAQVDDLLAFIKTMPDYGPRFDVTHILYYMGGLLAIGAMTLFMNLGWEAFGGWGIVALCAIYGVAALKLTETFRKRNLSVPAGICAVFVVALTPLAVYGLQQGMGWWVDGSVYRDYHRYIRWHWIFMEIGTLLVGAVMAWRYRYPFLVMPIAATLWYISMDLAPMLTGGRIDFQLRALVSLWFGLANILFAFFVDIRSRNSADYAFWLYLFAVAAFWGGLSSLRPSGELSRLLYCLINIGLIGVGVVLVRRVFVVFGAIGCTMYLGHLSATVFKESWFFPISLTLIGLGIVCLGLWWQKNEEDITAKVQGFLPGKMVELLEQRGDSR